MDTYTYMLLCGYGLCSVACFLSARAERKLWSGAAILGGVLTSGLKLNRGRRVAMIPRVQLVAVQAGTDMTPTTRAVRTSVFIIRHTVADEPLLLDTRISSVRLTARTWL